MVLYASSENVCIHIHENTYAFHPRIPVPYSLEGYVCVCVWVCECVCSVVSNSLQPHGLEPGRLLIHGIFQARMLKWVAISYSSGSPQPRDRTWSLTSSALSGGLSVGFFPLHYLGSSLAAAAKSLQSCLTLCDPIDGSPPGSPVPGILQARTLEWVAISFSNACKWKVKVKSLSRVRPSARGNHYYQILGWPSVDASHVNIGIYLHIWICKFL